MTFNYKKIWSRFELRADVDPLKYEPRVERDWRVILLLAVILLLVVAGLNWSIYQQVMVLPSADSLASPKFKTADLEKTEAFFTARQVKLESYRSNAAVIADPSR